MRFYAELGDLLASERRGREFEHEGAAGGSVKDLIEGLGIPHTEVDLILVNGRSVDFAHHVQDGDRVSVYPVFEALDISPVVSLRPKPLRVTRFVADVHLGRLAGYLRLCGFDTLYRIDWIDRDLAETAAAERRILLTRDRRLLMRSIVTHGYLVRDTRPRHQLNEVLHGFDLWKSLAPFTRCSVCNKLVEPVAKAEVAGGLPPRTAEYYQEFWRCTGCGRVYWKGAHYRSLSALFSEGGAASGCE
ncbi:MAG: Mut7-C ubiquitin/RNAse domain-containing protein [Thermoleophilia bacterium]|nr:Mut7-C ubiquitin/RNAse domain-containing protein [Thermoleophilia bacterium]